MAQSSREPSSAKRKSSSKWSRTSKTRVYLIGADGVRIEVTGALGFAIAVGKTELEVILSKPRREVDGYLARLQTKGTPLLLGPGDGNSMTLRTARKRGIDA